MTDKIAIVTGGTAGVGRAVVDLLIRQGYTLGVIARGKARLREVEARHGAERIRTASCDVSDAADLSRAAREIADAIGAPTAWINCAMLTSFSPFMQMAPDEFERIVAGTFLGQVNGTRAALEVMAKTGTPVIINVGSGLSYRAVPLQSAYCASKHAINGFTSSVQSELIRAGHPARLSLVQLPAMNTPQFDWAKHRFDTQPQPAPPIYDPQVAAEAVLRAIRDRPRELFVGQSVLKLVIGDMVLPNWLDKKMADSGADMQKSERDDIAGQGDGNLFAPDPDRPSSARGSYDARAKRQAVIVNADTVRKMVFAGLPVCAFLLGLVLG